MAIRTNRGWLTAFTHTAPSTPARAREALHRIRPSCESLEMRTVLSQFGPPMGFGDHPGGGALIASLGQVGVFVGNAPGGPAGATTTGTSQLDKDLATLRAEYQTLAAKSGLTVADQAALQADDAALAAASPDRTNLQAAVSELVTATAAGTDATQAKADFAAVFSGSTVSQTAITQAVTDIAQAVTDSKITTDDLAAVAADQAAVQADLGTGHGGDFGDHGRGGDHGFGGGLAAILNQLGVVTGVAVPGGPLGMTTAGTSQLDKDLTALRTDLQGLAAKSGLTVADQAALATDSAALDSGTIDRTALRSAVSSLVTAAASGSDVTSAESAFAAVFTGTTVSSSAIGQAEADIIRATQDSKVTPADLTTLAALQTAVQNDAPGHGGGTPGHPGGPGTGGSGSGTAGGTGSGTGKHRKVGKLSRHHR